MKSDRYNLKLTTNSTHARDSYIHAVDAVLSAADDPDRFIDKCLLEDPHFALIHCVRARVHQLNGNIQESRLSAKMAITLSLTATERERQHANIFWLLANGKNSEALDLIKRHVSEYPRDAFALAPACSVFGLIGFSGRVAREPEQVSLLEPLISFYDKDWWFLTVYAFSLIEVGEWEKGLTLIEEALDIQPRSAHSAHVKAHALYESGNDKSLANYLIDWLPDYPENYLLNCHIWWHLCLAKLMLGETETIFDMYDQHCSPDISSSPAINIFTDGASLLWRAELAGMKVSDSRWRKLLDYRNKLFPRPIVFVDAHGALPSIALGNSTDLEKWQTLVTEYGTTGFLPAGTIPSQLTTAFAAYARRDWNSVINVLRPILSEVVKIGGSRAQRDLIQNTLLSAFINDGRPQEARTLLAAQTDRGQTVPLNGLN